MQTRKPNINSKCWQYFILRILFSSFYAISEWKMACPLTPNSTLLTLSCLNMFKNNLNRTDGACFIPCFFKEYNLPHWQCWINQIFLSHGRKCRNTEFQCNESSNPKNHLLEIPVLRRLVLQEMKRVFRVPDSPLPCPFVILLVELPNL